MREPLLPSTISVNSPACFPIAEEFSSIGEADGFAILEHHSQLFLTADALEKKSADIRETAAFQGDDLV